MKFWRAALFIFLSALALQAQESGISPYPPDPARPLPHDAVVRVSWSETNHAGTVEIDHRKFSGMEDIMEAARARVAADPDLRIVFCPAVGVPLDFGKQVLIALRQAGVTRIVVAMPELPVTLPPAKGAPATPPPGPQLIVQVTWSAVDGTGGIEIEGKKFAKADEILEMLQAEVKAKPDLRILIRADRNVRYPFLKEVMIAAGKAGAGKVTFSVVEDRPSVPAQK